MKQSKYSNFLFLKLIFISLILLLSVQSATSQQILKNENGKYGLAITNSNGSITWMLEPDFLSIEQISDETYTYKAYAASKIIDNELKWGVFSENGSQKILFLADKQRVIDAYLMQIKHYIKNHGAGNSSPFKHNYTDYIKKYVEQKINVWQKKGEFEKTSDYLARVSEESRNAMIIKYTKEACDECLNGIKNEKLNMTLDKYDPDNETFLIKTDIGQIIVPVSIDKAPQFKNSWHYITCKNTFDIVNGYVVIKEALFYINTKLMATYSDQNNALYAQANIQYNFDPIEIPSDNTPNIRQPLIAQNTIQVGKSDIDMDIPNSTSVNQNTFALIFANENYREETNVDFAHNDGNAVEKYFSNTLGIPSQNIHFVKDATKNDMIREIDWIKNVSSVYKDDMNLMVYYAGHGVPNEADGSAYLIPIDGVGTNPKTLYSLSEFYNELGSIPSKSTVLFLDACFSGALRGDGMLASARGISLKAKKETPKSNMIVLSAASGAETAWPYREKGHGLFTYFLLKKLQSSKGNVSLRELSDFVTDQVGKQSIVSNSKKQTPTISISPNMSSIWENLKLK